MRAYFFGNMYLSSIQQGIQAAHVVAELYEKYREEEENSKIIQEWATQHKTMILLNAGYSEEIRSLEVFFATEWEMFPWASFREGRDALDGALTCIGIILPERIYEAARKIRTSEKGEAREFERTQELIIDLANGPMVFDYNHWEVELINRLNNYGMAR